MKTFLIRGVPLAMQQDGWWLDPSPRKPQETTKSSRSTLVRLGLLIALISAGDVLLWHLVPGLSLALFALVCFSVAAGLFWKPGKSRSNLWAAGLATLSVLPLIESVQPLSLMMFAMLFPVSLSVLAGRCPKGSLRFWWLAPLFSLGSMFRLSKPDTLTKGFKGRVVGVWSNWALPVGVGAVFASLLIGANPVVESFLSELTNAQFAFPSLSRILFWCGLGLIVWPIVVLPVFAPKLSPDPKITSIGPRRMPRIINPDALLRSLVLFNVMFSVQNAMDLAFLAGGLRLPDGMSFAEYAHRGAYPLVLLALLSGAFALLVRPFIPAAPVLRALLLIWLAQTIWLTFSSFLRLDLYIQEYGLTRLRLSAGIWIALVAAGLALTLWQVARSRDAKWLLQRVGLLGLATLYACCFVSFDASIARFNLQSDVPEDRMYICRLGEGAVPEITKHTGQSPREYCWSVKSPSVSIPRDWREWGFRNARLRNSLQTMTAQRVAQ